MSKALLLLLLAQMPPLDSLRPGQMVEIRGRQIRTSRIPRDNPEINARLFIAVDAGGNEIAGQLFEVEGAATETATAKRLNRTRGDRQIRTVRGTVSQVRGLRYNGGTVPGPVLTHATIDGP